MCEICEKICQEIAEKFGHQVSPVHLALLIEESPLVNRCDGQHKKMEVKKQNG